MSKQKELKLCYQSRRKRIVGAIYFPEDRINFTDRVVWVKKYRPKSGDIVITWCAYIAEGVVKKARDKNINVVYVKDGREVDSDTYWGIFAKPMRDLFRL